MSLLLIALLAQAPADAGAGYARRTAYARVALAQQIAADGEIVAAIQAKNRTPETPDEIHGKDAEWRKNRAYPLRKELTHSPCAARLRSLVSVDVIVVEAMVMDKRGGLVCASAETSDYDQADEAKWQKTVSEGKTVFVDDPTLDQSSSTYGVQLSVLASEGEERIGAITLTLKVPQAASSSKP